MFFPPKAKPFVSEVVSWIEQCFSFLSVIDQSNFAASNSKCTFVFPTLPFYGLIQNRQEMYKMN